jgi:N-methylhydantoinase A
MALTVGIDVGGTFTDFALMDDRTGALRLGKVLTSADDPSRAVLAGLRTLLAEGGFDARDLAHAVHATTIATNTVIQRKGLPTALLTTEGFRDVLLIGRQRRFELYDNSIGKPRPIVPRELCFEVPERLMWDGSVRRPLDEDAVRTAALAIRASGAAGLGICFLHSYANPAHERRARDIVREVAPEVLVSISSEVSPVYREYERASTTVLNAYVMPVVSAYIGRIEDGLAEMGRRRSLYIMQSNGGIASGDYVRRHPIRIIESGPAAGVLTAARYAEAAGTSNLISFDMGGTTAKVCLIENGRPGMTETFEVDMINLKPNSGIPMNIPAIDLVEIGAGGGSIARAEMGGIKVGPISAGSSPGPICYGLGGREPTVTDANLVLGYLNPDYFLGGTMALDLDAARAGIMERVATPLGMTLEEAAWGIYEVVSTQMAQAARAVSIGKGRDPRHFALIPFGGAGPLHGAELARQLGCGRVVFPKGAGVETAIGLLMADPAFDVARTSILALKPENLPRINELLAGLAADTGRELDACGVDGERHLVASCDMRFVGQGYELTVELPAGPYRAEDSETIRQAFLRTYAATYGERAFDPKAPIEGVLWRMAASIRTPRLTHPDLPADGTGAGAGVALKGRRPAYFRDRRRAEPCDVYDRYLLPAGARFTGPAIVEERESTIVLPPGAAAQVDAKGNLVVDFGG